MTWWLERLDAGAPLLLDGATGTELERRGETAELPLWSAHALLRAPALVERVHADYVAAGAELLTANSFRTQRRTLERAGIGERAAELTASAVALARSAASRAPRPVAVLGSAPPLEDCFRPDRVPESGILLREHAEHARNLARAGADGVLIETMNTAREAAAALAAAHGAGLPALVSFVCWEGARLLSGEPLEVAIAALGRPAPAAVLVNCLPPSQADACLPVLARSGLAFGLYPNLVGTEAAPIAAPLAPARFASLARGWVAAGARIVGGCCGTTPQHVAALAQQLA